MLIGVTFGLAAFYVVPYVQTTQAMYYENLKNYAIAQGKAAPAEFGLMPVPPYGAQPPVSAQPYAQNPQAPYQGNPYTANPYAQPAPNAENPYAQNAPYTPPQAPCADPNAQAQSAQPFTPPAPESTFVPGDESPSADEAVFNGEKADDDKQDF